MSPAPPEAAAPDGAPSGAVAVLGPVHHVGVACRDLEAARRWVHATHTVLEDSGVVYDPHQKADLCLLTVEGGANIELVAGEAVASLVKKGHTYYHLCYEVPSVAEAIVRLQAQQCLVVSPPAPAVLFGGRTVAFLYGPTGLVELLET